MALTPLMIAGAWKVRIGHMRSAGMNNEAAYIRCHLARIEHAGMLDERLFASCQRLALAHSNLCGNHFYCMPKIVAIVDKLRTSRETVHGKEPNSNEGRRRENGAEAPRSF